MLVFNGKRSLLGALLAAVLVMGIAGFSAAEVNPLRGLLAQGQPGGLEKLQAIIEIIEKRYVDKVDIDKVIDGAIAGAVRALGDPYSDYMASSEWDEFMIRARGSYSGVGLTIGSKDKYIVVISPIKGSPAARAGIKPGDRILKVDGKELYDVSTDRAAEMIRGPVGTQVILTILPAGGDAPVEYTLTRENITIVTVDSRMLDGRIGYIQITQFGEGTAVATRAALDELKSSGARAIVLDLRGNPGGILDECVEVAELFVPEGPIVSVVDRQGQREVRSSESAGLGMPLVVLVDEGSASASEIVAGAVQDRKAGVIVGKKTFGKGSVQSLINLKDGSGIRLTTAKYYTPSGRSIHGKGIDPDIVVERGDRRPYQPLTIKRRLTRMTIGLDVLALQQHLNLLGYSLSEDGIYGDKTAAAVASFQGRNGLAVTGSVDERTVEALNRAVAKAEEHFDPQMDKAIEVLKAQIK